MAEPRRTPAVRDVSPDSVILTFESNFNSLFSSASASVDRCSFASDAQDHDCLSSDFSQNLSGNGGSDLSNNGRYLSKKVEKAKVYKEENNKVVHPNVDHVTEPLDSARNSFSLALKECQERRSRSEAVNKKSDRRRPASLDLNNSLSVNVVSSSSPKFGGVMKKGVVTPRKSGNFPSPGTPNYRHGSVGMAKGWSSERVPLPCNGINRRQIGAALLPLSNNGRGLPSKWEDAERWIFSPVSGDGVGRTSSSSSSYQQPKRRPKSKSGPLGPPGVSYYSLYSPAVPMYYEGNHMGSHTAGSPFSSGAMLGDGWSFRASGETRDFSNTLEPCIARSASVHGCTDLVCQGSLTSSQDERVDGVKNATSTVSRAISRRDMATQMSPEGSCHSSPRRSSFSPSTPSILPIMEVQSSSTSKPEVRDVQIDERVTVTRWSKKYRGRNTSKESEVVDEWKLKVEPCSSAWEVSETVKSLSKARRDESKISAWENLQKAKAEAAIRKLEMKLEKKRSSSMNKIMKKLKSAQKKAQNMRSTILTNQTLQVPKMSNNAVSFQTRQMGSLSGCFTCHAF
ncbi:uncharacterized protein LOC110693817 isoform X1 [Chenopodium quinoa]|uniref:Remorin C-terminal domain-containing protein n=1 Tax=Chenopodium quinoa TaxID=63459 RepID=A0A803MKM7_CHEQI|nr:uncharacterized protein LOC110693817 isoform X1 [Chenopodium quinoa]